VDESGVHRSRSVGTDNFWIFLLLSVNFDYILKDVESQVEITAYLEDSVDQDGITKISKDIAAINGVKEIKFISKEEAIEEFKEQVGKELLEGIENPFPIHLG